jgi:hypothetical protein
VLLANIGEKFANVEIGRLCSEARSRWHVALELYFISFNDFAVKIGVAEGAANRLARDRADHQERNKRKLMGHFEHNKN